jgi:hypothetical protein
MLDSFTSRLGWLDSLLTAMALEVLTVTEQKGKPLVRPV